MIIQERKYTPCKTTLFLPINQFFLQKTSHPTIHEFINQTINQLTKQLIYQTNQIKLKKRGRSPMSNPQTAIGSEGLNQTEYKAQSIRHPDITPTEDSTKVGTRTQASQSTGWQSVPSDKKWGEKQQPPGCYSDAIIFWHRSWIE